MKATTDYSVHTKVKKGAENERLTTEAPPLRHRHGDIHTQAGQRMSETCTEYF